MTWSSFFDGLVRWLCKAIRRMKICSPDAAIAESGGIVSIPGLRYAASGLHLLEYRDRLDMRSLREHVHHTRRLERVAMRLHQFRRIARQRGGAATHIDNAARRGLRGDGFHQFRRTVARRVDQPFIEMATMT